MPLLHQPFSLESMCISSIACTVLDCCVLLSKLVTKLSNRLQETPRCSGISEQQVITLDNNQVVMQKLLVTEAAGSWGCYCLPTPNEFFSIIKSDNTMKDICINIGTLYNEIQNYVAMIAPHFADQYTVTLLQEASSDRDDVIHWDKFTLRPAFHPMCTTLNLSDEPFATTNIVKQVLNNLETLKELECLDIYIRQSSMTKKLMDGIPYLKKLRKLWIPATMITDEHNFFSLIFESCPHLQELSFKWGLSRDQSVVLASFPNLTRVHVILRDQTLGTDVLYILNTVPQLQEIRFPNELLSNMLENCKRRYTVKKMDSPVTNSEQLDRIVRHFPMLEYISVDLPTNVSLSPLNQLVHLRTLILKGATPEQISDLGPLLHDLDGLYLEDVREMNVALNPDCFSLQNIKLLSLDTCLDVDLEYIWKVFPHLITLDIIECTMVDSDPMPELTETPFCHLRYLDICDWDNAFEKSHLRYLMSSCQDLRTLRLDMVEGLEDATFHSLLKCNPMPRLRKMIITSSAFSLGILPIVTEYIGDELELLTIEFDELTEDPEVIHQKFQEYSGWYGNLEIRLHIMEYQDDP